MITPYTKVGEIIAKPASMGDNAGPYYPDIIDMSAVTDYPFNWAIVFTTDHDLDVDGDGGVWLFNINNQADYATTGWRDYDVSHAAGDFDTLSPVATTNPIYQYTAGGDGDQTETACFMVLGSTVVMTTHNDGGPYNQTTNTATSSNGVDFSHQGHTLFYDDATRPGNGHCGYFKWGPNPFSGVNYEFVGYSLHGGGGDGHFAIWGSNDPTAYDSWEFISVIDYTGGPVSDDLPDGYFAKWNTIDVKSIRPLGGGLYAALIVFGTRFSGIEEGQNQIYQVVLDHTGQRIVRSPVEVLPRGGASAIDEAGCNTPVMVQEAGVDYLYYIGTDTLGNNRLALATRPTPSLLEIAGDFAPLEPDASYAVERFAADLQTTDALPSWLTGWTYSSGVTNTPHASGYETTITSNGSRGGVQVVDPITPTDYDFVEFWFADWFGEATAPVRYPRFGFYSDAADVNAGPSLEILTFGSVDGLIQLRSNDGSTTIDVEALYDWGYNNNEVTSVHSLGIRIWPNLATPRACLLGNSRQEYLDFDLGSLDLGGSFYPMAGIVRSTGAGTLRNYIGGLELVLGTQSPEHRRANRINRQHGVAIGESLNGSLEKLEYASLSGALGNGQ